MSKIYVLNVYLSVNIKIWIHKHNVFLGLLLLLSTEMSLYCFSNGITAYGRNSGGGCRGLSSRGKNDLKCLGAFWRGAAQGCLLRYRRGSTKQSSQNCQVKNTPFQLNPVSSFKPSFYAI